jgi:hypothetical protein
LIYTPPILQIFYFGKYSMYEKDKNKIKEIIGGMKCPKDFQCSRSGFKFLCNARDIGLDSYLVCLEKHPLDCLFSMSFGSAHLCKCPLRVYIAQNLEK